MELFKSRLLSEGSIWHIGSLSAVYLSQGLSGGTLFALTTYPVSYTHLTLPTKRIV